MLANAKQFESPTNKTHGPQINAKGKKIQKWLERKIRNWKIKVLRGKPARKCLWPTGKQIARVKPARNYHSG